MGALRMEHERFSDPQEDERHEARQKQLDFLESIKEVEDGVGDLGEHDAALRASLSIQLLHLHNDVDDVVDPEDFVSEQGRFEEKLAAVRTELETKTRYQKIAIEVAALHSKFDNLTSITPARKISMSFIGFAQNDLAKLEGDIQKHSDKSSEEDIEDLERQLELVRTSVNSAKLSGD